MCNCKKKAGASTPAPARSSASSAPVSRISIMQNRPLSSNREVQITDLPGETLAEKCRAFSCLLGLEETVDESVLIGAVDDAGYARKLLASTNDPVAMQELIDNPPRRMYERLQKNPSSFSNAVLIAKAGKALLKWGASGFSTVSRYQLEMRENACLVCPNLSEPESVLQKLTASSGIGQTVGSRTGNKICGVCGCVVKNKMRLATDTCPEEDPAVPGFNHWGEPHIP